LVPNPKASGFIAWSFTCYIMCLLCNLGTTVICPPISLERILQVLSGEDRKSMSGDCFSVLATLILHMFDLALHAYLMMLFPYSMFLFFIFFKKKKN